MQKSKKLTTKDVALTTCFTALYAVFCLVPLFQIVGLPSKSITMAAIIAPIIGILLGPYLGALSTILGGTIGFFAGFFSLPSFVSGVVAAFSAGTLYFNKRSLCAFTYFSLLFFFGFYPFVGPVWIYPPLMWFQIVVFLILVSPLQSIALKDMWNPKSNTKLVPAFFITSLTSTLAGQIAGSLVFEAQFSWPMFLMDVNVWKLNWQVLTWIYPWERVVIALAAAFIGVALFKVLKAANLMHWLRLSMTIPAENITSTNFDVLAIEHSFSNNGFVTSATMVNSANSHFAPVVTTNELLRRQWIEQKVIGQGKPMIE